MEANTTETRLHISQVIREIHRALVDSEDRQTLESEVCEAFATSSPYVFAWIGTHDPETDHVVPRTSASVDSEYLDEITISVTEAPTKRGPTARAVRTDRIQVMQDIRNDPEYEPWREQALDHGFESSAAVPIADDGNSYGVLNLYADRSEAFDEREQQLLSELGETIATAISGIEARVELEAEKEKHERFTTRISDGYYAVDSEWRITFWNEQMAARTETPASEVRGKTLWEAFPAIEGTELEAKYREALAEMEPASFDFHVGEPFDYWVEIDVYPDDEGLSIFSRKITERKEREEELAETNSLLASIIDNLPVGVLVEDSHRTITATNSKLFEIFETPGSPEDLVGRDCSEVAEELKDLFADPDEFTDRIDEILSARDSVFDEELALSDGRTLARSYVSYSVPGGEGNLWLYRDITDRKRRMRTLERQNFLFDRMQEIANAGIWEYDPDTDDLSWSEGVRSIHGVDPSYEPTLEAALAFYDPADRDAIETAVERAMEAGELYDLDLQIVRENGEVRDVRTRGEALTDASGSTTMLRGVFQDITEQKEYERRLNRLHEATRDLMQADTHESIAEIAVETARDTLDLPINGLWLYDESANVLRPTAITDAGRDLLGEPPVYEPGDSLSWEAFQAQEAKTFEDVTAQSGRHNPETPLQSEIILPLGDHGVMNIGAVESAAFDETDRSLGLILATNVESALTRADQQQELAQQAERLDLALEAGQLGVWDWNVRTDTVTFDERWAGMLGYSLDEIEPHLDAWEKRAHPDDLPDAEAALEAHFAGETEYYRCEHRMQTKSGEWIWVNDIGKVVERDDDGEPVRAVGIHQDITTDRRRERMLRETLEQIRALIEAETASEAAAKAVEIADQTLSFPISGVHLERDEERLEPAAVTDSLREELGSAPTYERTGGDRHVDDIVWDVHTSGGTEVITDLEQEFPETTGETPSQSVIVHSMANHGVFITSATSPDAFDEFDQYLAELLAAILTTTLDRVHQEQQIESQRDNLDLLNQIVRHDIRNDLQVLLARLDVLTNHVDDAGREYLETAQNSADNAIELTQTAQAMSEVLLRDGTDRQPVALRSVINRQLDEVRSTNPHASVTTDGLLPSATVIANDMFDAVIRNLLKNAVQHNDKELPEVEISATERADSVLLRVADNGPGVPDEQKDSIFGKGEKGLESTGTGIGLYLVHMLVESYGGDVWVEDNDPEGAVFVVELPKAT